VSAKRTEGGHFDLILAGYTFAELPSQTRDRVLAHLWNACTGILVIVEPGTPAGFATILACRTALIGAGARMVAPCPGAHPCPIVAPDWCHFAERLPRSRAHMRAKDASVPFEDERYSYVAVAREGIEIAPIEARIIAPPQAAKPGTRLRLCTRSGIADRVVLKRDKPAYKAVSRKTWGDSL
jgi:ribosomal protein RSM22 (predicted rRNA methylase)